MATKKVKDTDAVPDSNGKAAAAKRTIEELSLKAGRKGHLSGGDRKKFDQAVTRVENFGNESKAQRAWADNVLAVADQVSGGDEQAKGKAKPRQQRSDARKERSAGRHFKRHATAQDLELERINKDRHPDKQIRRI